jgi:hypothetical protein
MRKMLLVTLSSAAIGAGAIATATPAAAFWPLIVPIIVGVGAGGIVTGAAIGSNVQGPNSTVVTSVAPGNDYPAPVYAAPASGCVYAHRWINGGWRGVEICD